MRPNLYWSIAVILSKLPSWLWKILRKGIWVFGFLPQLISFISTYIPREYIPVDFQNLIEKGGTWQLTLILVIFCLFLSAYLVHLDIVKESDDRELKIREIEDREPNLQVGFQDEAHRLAKILEIRLAPLPPKPDFDSFVEAKKKKLFPESRPRQSHAEVADLIRSISFTKPNPNYKGEVEEYLLRYRQYLIDEYECKANRAYFIRPIIENRGFSPANSIAIEFVMPPAYKKPTKMQYNYAHLANKDKELKELALMAPREPEPTINLIPQSFSHYPIWTPTSSEAKPILNVDGPVYKEVDGLYWIEYSVSKLVQHRSEDSFKPFLLWLSQIEMSTVWNIKVKITSADLHQVKEETLILNITVKERPSQSAGSISPEGH